MLNPTVEQEARRLIAELAEQEFGDNFDGVHFFGPYEDEDLDAEIYLKERESGNLRVLHTLANVKRAIRRKGWDIPMGWKVSDSREGET